MSRFGEWSIDWEVYDWLIDHLPFGSTILEFGSGWASGEMSKRWKVFSIEENATFIGKHKTSYIHAPIDEMGWYSKDVLERELPKHYDLILIDGPGAKIRKNIEHRSELFNWNVPVIIDDMQEDYLLESALKLVTNNIKRPYQIMEGGSGKKFMVIPNVC